MKLYLLSIISLICFELKAQNSVFEGAVRFSTTISTTNQISNELLENLKEKYGDSLDIYYSDKGDFKRLHINSGDRGAKSQLYKSKKGVLYITHNDGYIDSLNVKINTLQLIKARNLPNEKIMGLDCKCLEYEATSMYQQHVFLTYCFSEKTPKLNPKLYEKHNDFFLNEFYSRSKTPYLKFSIQTEEFKITYLAYEIYNQKINDKLFELE